MSSGWLHVLNGCFSQPEFIWESSLWSCLAGTCSKTKSKIITFELDWKCGERKTDYLQGHFWSLLLHCRFFCYVYFFPSCNCFDLLRYFTFIFYDIIILVIFFHIAIYIAALVIIRDVPNRFFSPWSRSESFLIFCKCRYWVLIWNLASANVFLDKTAAIRKIVPACKLFLNCFFILLKQSIYFDMVLSYSAYAIATLAYHPPCISKWVYDAALWQQNLEYSQLNCVWDAAHALYLHIIHCFFHIPYVVT